MLGLLWLIPTLPLVGFLVLALVGPRLARPAVAVVGVGSVALAAGLAALVAVSYLAAPPPGGVYTQTLWTWLSVGGLRPEIAFQLDALSLIFVLVVTFVGALIHLYSVEYMADDEGYSRFFAYMNLFVAAMLTLVLANNLVLLLLGWEGVGLCSYLLIGFWYRDPANGRAARKAFIVTRIGDTALLIALFLLFVTLGTLTIPDLLARAARDWPVGSSLAAGAATLILIGALGKSAQLPLQTWLPDAMAGPTPVSALIHAATMVTAGVYLIARTHVLFALAPSVMLATATIGALTLLVAGFSALVQSDIKRALAYSTISQIGYMFLALGVGAWSAGVFHFMTHAFFKAVLFLGAGAVILAMHHEQDMFRMGGLRRALPLTYWTFLFGSAALAGVPFVTAGFYSKDMILLEAWSSALGGPWLYAAGLFGAFLTAVYTFRIVFLTFHGEARHSPAHRPGLPITLPLVVLGALSLVGGFVQTPSVLGNVTVLSDFLHTALPAAPGAHPAAATEWALLLAASVAALLGIYLAYLLFVRSPETARGLATTPAGSAARQFWREGWGFDWLYDVLLVRPYVYLTRASRRDVVDAFYGGISQLTLASYRLLSSTQSGQVRAYAAGIALGAVLVVAIGVFS